GGRGALVERGSSDPRQRSRAEQPNSARDQQGRSSGMTWPPASPFALVLERARQQDQQALSTLYQRYLPVVYRFVLARVDNPDLAEDLTADTFFAMVKDIGGPPASDELGF